MTRAELLRELRCVSSGTVASAIGSARYAVIDRVMSNVSLYAADVATGDEIARLEGLAGVLDFIVAHKDYVARV